MSLQENEKVNILIEQLKIANQRWRYLEESRMRLLEIFLSFIGATAFALIFSKNSTSLLFAINPNISILIPLLFLFIGLGFYSFFWFREMYYRITKSWIIRIERELHIIFSGKIEEISDRYDGSHYLYYYQPSNKFDLTTTFLSFLFFILTTIVVLFVVSILIKDSYEPKYIKIFFFLSCILFIVFQFGIRKYFEIWYRKNSKKYPPTYNSTS